MQSYNCKKILFGRTKKQDANKTCFKIESYPTDTLPKH